MIVTGFTHRSKSVNFFQTTVFCQHRCKFQKYTIDVYTIFQQSFQWRNFLFSLSERFKIQVCIFPKLMSVKEKFKTKTTKENKRKEKYVHSIQRVVIRRNIFSELGHSPDRCQAALLDSTIEKSWDLTSQQLKMVQAISFEILCALPFPHAVCPILRQDHLLQSSYQR